MVRIGKFVMGLFLAWGLVNCSYAESTYDSALSEFAGPCHLWLGEGLDKRLSRIKKPEATCYVIFEKEWESSKAIFAVDLVKGRIAKVVKIDKSGSIKGIDVTDFQRKSSLPSLMAYNHKVYMNSQQQVISPEGDGPLGFRVFGSVYGIRADLDLDVPRERISVKVVYGGKRPELLKGYSLMSTTDEVLSDFVNNVASQMSQKEDRERQEMLKKLKRRPPVVYGDSKMIKKRIDGTFEIPKEEPTKKWIETIYATGTADVPYSTTGITAGGSMYSVSGTTTVDVSIPIGEREREEKLKQVYDYPKLKAMREEWERKVRELENEVAVKVDTKSILRSVKELRLAVETR